MKDQLDALINQMMEHGVHFEDAVGEFEKRFIRKVLEKYNGNRSEAAKFLGIHRNTLSRKMEAVRLDHQPRRRKRAR
ncbi:MAG: histidine kinase [Acidobacteriota bacterium]|nr:histidine kinase [Acidobacteriota bacterium]